MKSVFDATDLTTNFSSGDVYLSFRTCFFRFLGDVLGVVRPSCPRVLKWLPLDRVHFSSIGCIVTTYLAIWEFFFLFSWKKVFLSTVWSASSSNELFVNIARPELLIVHNCCNLISVGFKCLYKICCVWRSWSVTSIT